MTLKDAKARHAISRFCLKCKTPWALRAMAREDGLVISCTSCGHVRLAVPRQRG